MGQFWCCYKATIHFHSLLCSRLAFTISSESKSGLVERGGGILFLEPTFCIHKFASASVQNKNGSGGFCRGGFELGGISLHLSLIGSIYKSSFLFRSIMHSITRNLLPNTVLIRLSPRGLICQEHIGGRRAYSRGLINFRGSQIYQ